MLKNDVLVGKIGVDPTENGPSKGVPNRVRGGYVGLRGGRFLRLLRLMRLMRVVKLGKVVETVAGADRSDRRASQRASMYRISEVQISRYQRRS